LTELQHVVASVQAYRRRARVRVPRDLTRERDVRGIETQLQVVNTETIGVDQFPQNPVIIDDRLTNHGATLCEDDRL
jgi:hypothetical protein